MALDALLTVAQMGEADRRTIAAGTPGPALMAAAGAAVADAIGFRWAACPVTVLCGPGNNGGDGYVAARLLQARGWPVTVAALAPPRRGDAAHHAALWTGPTLPLAPAALDGAGLVVDALFGAGLDRPIQGPFAAVLAALGDGPRRPVVAVDVPSGVQGDTGRADPATVAADLTVTFFRAKPGHCLMPGRALCGRLVVADIGIDPAVLPALGPLARRNGPALWRAALPAAAPGQHKYSRGAVLVAGGPMTGAARLAARGARRAGAGLVSLAVPPEWVAVCAGDGPGLIVRPAADVDAYRALAADRRVAALVVGPGTGADAAAIAAALLPLGKPTVVDADALGPALVPAPTGAGPLVLTPHEGEFRRTFPTVAADGGKAAAARATAAAAGAVVLYKGPDTVIAAPDGRTAINTNAPPALATAGSGDVLAGIIGALLARGMPPFEAAAAAAWAHGRAGHRAGAGAIAEDLPEALDPADLSRS